MPTHNTLPSEARTQLVKLLNIRLADLLDLQLRLKAAHWNVRGAQFMMLHELFDDVAQAVQNSTDDLAERVGQLGGVAVGELREVAATTSLTDYKPESHGGTAVLEALVKSLAEAATKTRAGIDAASAAGDAVSADLLTEVTALLDKQLWFLESHLQG